MGVFPKLTSYPGQNNPDVRFYMAKKYFYERYNLLDWNVHFICYNELMCIRCYCNSVTLFFVIYQFNVNVFDAKQIKISVLSIAYIFIYLQQRICTGRAGAKSTWF